MSKKNKLSGQAKSATANKSGPVTPVSSTAAAALPQGLTPEQVSELVNNPRFPTLQRQQLAAQFGRQYGNRSVQRLVGQDTDSDSLYEYSSLPDPSLSRSLAVQRHTAVTPLYEEDSVQAQRLPELQRDLVDDLNEAMDGWGTDEQGITDAINAASPAERRAALSDARLVARLREELSRSEALAAITALGADLSFRLEVAMDGWFAESDEILTMVASASDDEKQAVLRNGRLINRLRDELSVANALTALNSLGASLIVRLNAALDGWSVDAAAIEEMAATASDAEKQAAVRDRALIDRLKSTIPYENLQSILSTLGVSLIDRLNVAMDGWGTDEQAILDMSAAASAEEKAAVLADNATIQRLASELSVAEVLRVFANLGLSLADRLNTALNGWGVDAAALHTMITAADEQQRQTVLADSATMGRLQAALSEADYNQARLLLRFGNQAAIDAASEEELAQADTPENLTAALSTQLDSAEPNVATMLNDITSASDGDREMVRTNHTLLERLAAAMSDTQFNQAMTALGGSVIDRLHILINQEAAVADIVSLINGASEEEKGAIQANRPLIDALLAYADDAGDRQIMAAIGDTLVNQLNHALDEGQTQNTILDLIAANTQAERDNVLLNSQLIGRLDQAYGPVDFWRVRLQLTFGAATGFPDGTTILLDAWQADNTYANIRRSLANLTTAQYNNIKEIVGIHDCVRELLSVPAEIQFVLRMLDQGLIAEEGDVTETWSEELLETKTTAPLVFEAKTFTGHTGFDIGYYRDRLQVDVRINLTPIDDDAEAAVDGLKSTWKAGIEGVWDNKYSLRNTNHTLPIRITCHFTSSDPHHSVNLRKGPARSNAGLWDTQDTTLVAAHEFGHLLGARDEYSLSADDYQNTVGTDPTVDPDASDQSDTAGNTRWTNTGNVMGNTSSGDIDKRHLNEMLNWLNRNRRRGDDGTFMEPAFTII